MSGKKITVGSDPTISLFTLKNKVDEWIKEYGQDAVFSTDAGYNNVSLDIDTRVKEIKRVKSTESKGEIDV
jgi:hypothetical protein